MNFFYRNSAVEVLNSIKMGQRWRHNISGRKKPLRSHVKFYSLLQKNKMPGAPKQQSLLKSYICQKNQLFMGNILPTLDFFCFYLFFRFHIHSKKSLCQKFNMTPAFITFTQKCSTNMINKKIISRDTLLFLSRCRISWRFSYFLDYLSQNQPTRFLLDATLRKTSSSCY